METQSPFVRMPGANYCAPRLAKYTSVTVFCIYCWWQFPCSVCMSARLVIHEKLICTFSPLERSQKWLNCSEYYYFLVSQLKIERERARVYIFNARCAYHTMHACHWMCANVQCIQFLTMSLNSELLSWIHFECRTRAPQELHDHKHKMKDFLFEYILMNLRLPTSTPIHGKHNGWKR